MAEVRMLFAALIEKSDGEIHTVGDLREIIVQTGLDGEVSDVTHDLAAAATTTLYDVDQLSLGAVDWGWLWIVSDQDILLELTTDKDAGVGKEVYTVSLSADVPFILSSRVSYANYTENFAGGTLDTIDRIRARNDGTDAAQVRAVLVR